MADKEEKPTEQPTEQPKGGDHIPTDTQEEDEEPKQQGGLLSKIGDPVGTLLQHPHLPVHILSISSIFSLPPPHPPIIILNPP